MDEHDICFDDEAPGSEHNRLLRIAAWAKEHNLLGPDREPRKILGTLPVTADGCVIGLCADLWVVGMVTVGDTDMPGPVEWPAPWVDTSDSGPVFTTLDGDFPPSELFSTRESAERAAKGGGDGQ